MNLPNKLTIFRIILVPVLVIISYLPINGTFLSIPLKSILMLAIFLIASITDSLDGKIARKYNLVTNFGKFLDPIADKILVISSLIYLATVTILPYWIVILIVFREFVITGYRLIVVEKGGKVIAASNLGKIKTATTMIAIAFGFLNSQTYLAFLCNKLNTQDFILNIIYSIFLTIAILATVISAIDYMKDCKKYLFD